MAATLVIFGALCPIPASADEVANVTVMSRNLYLGADVGVAMDLLPDFPAATEFMWEQVAKTDFANRANALAMEVVSSRPDVIGLQEATKWICTAGAFSEPITVFDFTKIFIDALEQRGLNYELASKDGNTAYNPGFKIAPIPYLTVATDENLFPSLFGSKKAACGFEIADALLINSDLKQHLIAAGTVEYDKTYPVIPTIMTIYRGYAWADIDISGTHVRFVTTHLESMWDANKVPAAKIQADELIRDLAETKQPLVVMGDFNSDPRDPRSPESNPGGQPELSEVCPSGGQVSVCNAYWTMVEAGFIDAGPDSSDPINFTWGTNALLTGPDEDRAAEAVEMGNPYGFTDRLDYVFTKNGVDPIAARVFDNVWPDGNYLWQCGTQECFPSDHAGLVAELDIKLNGEKGTPLDANNRFPIGLWDIVAISLIAIITWRVVRRVKQL